MNKITIVVVDDHRMIRDMWIKLFSFKQDLEVVGDAGDFDKAIEVVNKQRPNILLLDINLPPASGLDAVPLVRKNSPGTKIIAVSMHTETAYAKKMIRLGAKGYVTKNSSHSEIFKAIDEVNKGNLFICEEMRQMLSNELLEDDEDVPNIQSLSLREIEIIKLIKVDLTSKEIASKLNISIHTVNVHRQNILKKLKLKNTVGLINFINQNDLQY